MEKKQDKKNLESLSKLKGFINLYVSCNDLKSVQNLLIDYLTTDLINKKNHKLYPELQKYDIIFLIESLINLHYYSVLTNRGLYDSANKILKLEPHKELIKTFVIESVLDEVVLSLKQKNISPKNITTIISNYLKNNGKVSPQVYALINGTDSYELLKKVNANDIVRLLNIYGYTKISEYVNMVLSSEYTKPTKVHAK